MSKRINVNDIKRETFIQLPKWLFTEDKYKGLSNDIKVAYALLKDRYRLSIHTTENGKDTYVDEEGNIYFVYTVIELMDVLGLSDKTVTKVKKALIKAELLDEVRQGQGKANKYYLLEPTFEEPKEELKNNIQNEDKKTPQTLGGVENRKKYDSRIGDSTILESEELRRINKDSINNDSNKNYKENNYEEEGQAQEIEINEVTFYEFKEEYKELIDEEMFTKIRKQMKVQGLPVFTVQEARRQITRMEANKKKSKPIFDWASYFVGGIIKNRLSEEQVLAERRANKGREKLEAEREKREEEKRNRPKVEFYNWLEERD